MLKKAISIIIAFAAVLWAFFITSEYFSNHQEYLTLWKEDKPILTVLFWLLLLYLIVIGIRYFFLEKEDWTLEMTGFKFYLLFLFLVMFIGGGFFLASPLEFFTRIGFFQAELTLFGLSLIVSLAFAFIISVCFVSGKWVLEKGKIEMRQDSLEEFVLSFGAGVSLVIMGLFFLGVFHALYSPVVWLLFLILPMIFWKSLFKFWENFFTRVISIKTSYFSPVVFLLLFFGFVLAMNFIDVMRPVPIGWDDMGFYLNNAKLTAGYHHLVPGILSYGYIIFMSLGFLLFNSAMIGMYLSFLGGFIGILILIQLARRFMKVEHGILAGTILYLTPMFMFQSSQDMKIDPPLFLFLGITMYAFLMYRKSRHLKYLILTGVFAGMAIAVKMTALLLIFALLIVLAYDLFHWVGALAWFFLFIFVVLFMNRFSIGTHNIPSEVLSFIKYGSFFLFAFLQSASFFHRPVEWKRKMKVLLIFPVFLVITFSPWMIKNGFDAGNISPSSLISGKSESVFIDYDKIGIDRKACVFTAGAEEVDRYIGYDKGFSKLFALPWKMTMNTTVKGFYVDIGFVFLALLPVLVLWLLWFQRKRLSDLFSAISWLFFWVIYALEMKFNYFSNLLGNDSLEFYLIMLASFALIFYFLIHSIKRSSKGIHVLLGIMSAVIWFFWTFMGNGIIWYGIAGFLPMVLLLGYLVYETYPTSLRRIFWLFIWFSIFAAILNRSSVFGRPMTISYAYGITDFEQTMQNIVPQYVVIGDVLNNDKPTAIDPKLVYRIGTFAPFFVDENNRRMFNDSQLDNFKCFDGMGGDDLATLDKLKSLGFKYILLDLNVATIEQDKNGTLHQKANRFLNWLNNLSQQGKLKVEYNSQKRGVAFMEIL